MKQKNKFRTAQKENVHQLENELSFKERFFSMLALRRGFRRLKKCFPILLIAVPVVWGIVQAVDYALEKAYSLSIDHISYVSRHQLISRAQAMEILGIQDAVNMATLDVKGMQEKLLADPCIAAATIQAEMPETLHIEITERIPVVYVESENSAETGTRKQLFMDPNGALFPVKEEYHRNFLNVPTWYLRPEDAHVLEAGVTIDPEKCRPIKELIAASNAYSLAEIPAICEIFRPKEWKMILSLENGTEVLMQVYDIKGQLARLAMVLEHARVQKKAIRSVNVIPRINPAIIYTDETQKNTTSSDD